MTKFEYRILHNICYDFSIYFFQLLKLRKKEFSWVKKNPLTIRKFVLLDLAKEIEILKNHVNHYVIFKIRYSNFVIYQNLFMGCQVQKCSLNKVTLCLR